MEGTAYRSVGRRRCQDPLCVSSFFSYLHTLDNYITFMPLKILQNHIHSMAIVSDEHHFTRISRPDEFSKAGAGLDQEIRISFSHEQIWVGFDA